MRGDRESVVGKTNISPRLAFSFLRTALPIGGIGLVGIVYDRVDTLMLSVLSSATSVARYNVPFGFVRLSWLVPSVISRQT